MSVSFEKSITVIFQAGHSINGSGDEAVNQNDSETGSPGVAIALPKIAEPPKYAVVLYNDDYTTMEFVIQVLKQFFGKSEEAAVQVMLSVHQQGKGIAGLYSREVAETKVYQVTEEARAQGFPLKVELEETKS